MKTLITLSAVLCALSNVFTQSVGIGTTTPAPSAALDISSTTHGMLVPRMTTVQRTAITSPATGLLVFDTNTNSFWFKGGASWVELIDSTKMLVHKNGANIYTGMNGNVGIGTSTPSSKLDLSQEARTGSHASGRPLYVTGNIAPSSNGIEFRNSGGTQGIGFGSNTIYAAGSAPMQDLGFAAKGLANLIFTTGGGEKMRIASTGNIGIGVTDPMATLELARGSAPFGTMQINGTTHASHFNYGTPEDTYIRGGKADSKVIINDLSSGNVGIGTDNPQQKLHVAGNTHIAGNSHVTGNTTISEKLGIGTTTPNAPLQFSNDLQNRKIVLYEGLNNDHQYYGMGVNGSTFRYQVSGTGDSHVFFAGTGPGSSNELMRITGNGHVGIGTINPSQKLDVAGNTTISDKLGIGTTTPNAPLQFSNDQQIRKIVLYEGANNDHQFVGLGMKGGALGYHVGDLSREHIFYAGVDAGTSNTLMRIKGNGNAEITGSLEIGYILVVTDEVTIPGLQQKAIHCDCPDGTRVVGGGGSGYITPGVAFPLRMNGSAPLSETRWGVGFYNSDIPEGKIKAYAICMRVAN